MRCSKLGADIALARKKRSLTTVMMAERLGVAKSTYLKIEKGDPTVAMGAYAMTFFVLGVDEALGQIVDPRNDDQGLLLDAERLPKASSPLEMPRPMIGEFIAVHLGEEARSLGVLRYGQQGVRESSSFEYDVAWLDAAERFSVAPGLPLVGGPQFHRKSRDGSAFHAAIADTEPDGWGKRVIQRDHAKRRQHARRAGKGGRSAAAQLHGLSPGCRRCQPGWGTPLARRGRPLPAYR